ncbi:MAG: DUF2232 domain-containing protein [Gemmatimonadetes bacterium]|nr:DUF2232 domain-containing protein [Gemmatimonadota bacterium]
MTDVARPFALDPVRPESAGASRRALALFCVVLGTAVLQPTLIIAVPFVALAMVAGVRGGKPFIATLLAMIVVVMGRQDAAWFMERAWALTVGGAFVAATALRPAWRPTSRALAAVAGATIATGVFLAARGGGWETVDWLVSDHLRAAYAAWIDMLAIARQGEAVSPALASALYRTVEMQIAVFPALAALESVAALGVAWWLYVRVFTGEDAGLLPMKGFRFNDHLVWVMVAALLLVVVRSGDAVTRIGANLAFFMGALYALRGLAVVVVVSGGLSLVGYALFTVGFLFAAPVVIGFMVLFGIADTWLDLRARVGSVPN